MREKKINIDISKKAIYAVCTFLIVILVLITSGIVYALNSGNFSVHGHDASELESGGVPSDAVMAFNLVSCPTGWIPADGISGTPDLRGVFIRGTETFDAGSTYNNRDDDRSGAETLGSFQNDAFQSHRHQQDFTDENTGAGGSWHTLAGDEDNYGNIYTLYSGGLETRPKNVALIYCVKS